MHVSPITSPLSLDPNPKNWNWVLQVLITAFVVVLGLLHLLRSTASKYFIVDANFDSSPSTSSDMAVANSNSNAVVDACANCGSPTSKQCAGCKRVKYCSQSCQSKHWRLEHKTKCQELKSLKHSGKHNMPVTSSSSSGPDKRQKVVKVLFPYDEFIKLYDWDKPIFPPCGLLNCGNSCYANVVLQCLAHTRPLLMYLLDKGHRRDCRRNGWCFLCELEIHFTRASRNPQPFSPLNILSRLPSIGSNLGYGKQEDAHEFMRFAIDTMQSICLDEHGGEKLIDPKSQETTIIQHIFGGQLRSQIICNKCYQVSNQYESMMDLMVEIQGDSTSLQECLDQFTAKEWLHGENMYKCDGCKDYVSAWKHLTIHQAPNVLTIALKRFQSGRFGKINKKISFPENLDLSPYMSEERNGIDKYKLYAIVVHVDMLNASFFGHYICYTKGFEGEWYRIDDCKVTRVELEEVLSQGAYMLLYRRICARSKCLETFGTTISQQQNGEIMPIGSQHNCTIQLDNFSKPSNSNCSTTYLASDVNRPMDHPHTPAGYLRALGGSSTSTVASTEAAVSVADADVPESSTLGANALDSGTLTVATAESPVEVADVLKSSTFGVNALDYAPLTEASVEVPVEVADVHGSCNLVANALDDVSCDKYATSKNLQQNGETMSIGAELSSTIQLDTSSKPSNSSGISADLASDVYRLLDNSHTPDVHFSRALGDEYAFSNTVAVANAEVLVEVADTPRSSTSCINGLDDASREGSEVMSDKEPVNVSVIGISGPPGKLVEHDIEYVSHATCDSQNALVTTTQNSASCGRNDSNIEYLGLGKNKNEVCSNDMEVESVELNESHDQCNGVTDMLIDEFPINTYLDMPPENDRPPFVHG